MAASSKRAMGKAVLNRIFPKSSASDVAKNLAAAHRLTAMFGMDDLVWSVRPRLSLKQLRLIVPPTPVGQASKAAVTLVFSRSVIRLGSNFDANGHSATVRGVHPLLCGPRGFFGRLLIDKSFSI